LAHSVRLFPELASNLDRVDAGLPPTGTLVACAMHRTMMPATEWNREFIADLATQRTGLREPEMMGRLRALERAAASIHSKWSNNPRITYQCFRRMQCRAGFASGAE